MEGEEEEEEEDGWPFRENGLDVAVSEDVKADVVSEEEEEKSLLTIFESSSGSAENLDVSGYIGLLAPNGLFDSNGFFISNGLWVGF